ncbi:MAG: glucose-phosphatase [Hyphomicrobiales bacterium]|jgi:putative hydrolase of the HAD superfamily|nr:glucose-phosphatase [Hyphomicrobiales bacterium]
MKPGAADALLFDLGGVIIDIDFNRVFARWAASAGCDPVLLRGRFTQDEPYRRHEIGALGVEDYFASLRASLGIDLSDAQFLDGWNAIFVDEVPGIAALLARAAQRLPLYAFTNTNPAHAACWSVKFPDALKNFKKVFISSSIGLRKPDAAAFEFVVREIGAPAGRIVFFDDSPHNIEGARACGLQTVLVNSPSDVAAALAALGI